MLLKPTIKLRQRLRTDISSYLHFIHHKKIPELTLHLNGNISTNPKIYHQILVIGDTAFNGGQPLHHTTPPTHGLQQSIQDTQKETPAGATSLLSYLTPIIPSAPPKAKSLPNPDTLPQYAQQTNKVHLNQKKNVIS